MTEYDRIADRYDEHFTRPIDAWEDQRLAGLLRPHVDGRRVLDLGCGTGWLLDHCHPAEYTGIDASAPMLERLMTKHPHPTTHVVKAEVGTPDWNVHAPLGCEVVTATWAAHDLGDLTTLLRAIAQITFPGTPVLLHGQGPRYRHRGHYVLDGTDEHRGYLHFTPSAAKAAAATTGHTWLGATGTGATPDVVATTHRRWRATLGLPARWHYAFLAAWRTT